MKKLLLVSGIFSALLLPPILSGWAGDDDALKQAVRQGNEQFESADYAGALGFYETGLAVKEDNKDLNYNAAQAAYFAGDYAKAMEYYGKAGDSADVFLNAGNICFMAGETAEDENEKVQFYSQALQFYMTGIVKYPQNVPLKYNYELTKEKLEELPETEQENEEQSNEQNEENNEQQEGEQQEGEQQEGEQQESEQQENEQQENEQQEGEQQEGEQQESEQQENEQQEGEQQENEQQESEEQESYSEGEDTAVPNQEAIERILQMLESQEEESLKNNREVKGGNEGKNGW